MKPSTTIIASALIAVLASYATVKAVVPSSSTTQQDKKESAYDRVMRTGTLRCGYGISPPQLMKDVNTGDISGIDYEVWQEIGKLLDIKIEWAEEAGWGNFIEGLRTNRYDAFCSHMWPDYARSKFLTLSDPINYSFLQSYARTDDNRFDGHIERINEADVTIPVVDGDVSVMLAKTGFPKAKTLVLPQTSTVSDMFLSITTKKADVMFFTDAMFKSFDKENGGKLRKVNDVPASFLMPAYYGFKSGEIQLRDMINIAIRTLIDNGKMEQITHRYSMEYIIPKKNFDGASK